MLLARATILSAILLVVSVMAASRTAAFGTDRPVEAHRAASVPCVMAESSHSRANPTITVTAGTSSGETLSGLVESIPAPVIPGQDPPATVTVRVNGWIIDDPRLQWDAEEQAWKFDSIKFDEDHSGATVTITVTDTLTGATTTTTITIA